MKKYGKILGGVAMIALAIVGVVKVFESFQLKVAERLENWMEDSGEGKS